MKISKENQEKIKIGIWSAIGGAALAMIIGFNWGGWVNGSTSLSRGEQLARTAVIERLAPICLSQFNNDPNRAENFVTLKAKKSWEQEKYVSSQGWATMPSEKTPDTSVAARCSELIVKDS